MIGIRFELVNEEGWMTWKYMKLKKEQHSF